MDAKSNKREAGIFSRRKFLTLGGILAALGLGGGLAYRHFSSNSTIRVESFSTRGDDTIKNVLVMTGSARNGGNSQLLAEAFMDGARQAGHTVNVFHSGKTPVGACLNCGGCWRTGDPCVQKDAFSELEPMLEQADMLVFCSPLYWYNII